MEPPPPPPSLWKRAPPPVKKSQVTHLMFPTTFLQAPSATHPQYGSLEAIQDLDGTDTNH